MYVIKAEVSDIIAQWGDMTDLAQWVEEFVTLGHPALGVCTFWHPKRGATSPVPATDCIQRVLCCACDDGTGLSLDFELKDGSIVPGLYAHAQVPSEQDAWKMAASLQKGLESILRGYRPVMLDLAERLQERGSGESLRVLISHQGAITVMENVTGRLIAHHSPREAGMGQVAAEWARVAEAFGVKVTIEASGAEEVA